MFLRTTYRSTIAANCNSREPENAEPYSPYLGGAGVIGRPEMNPVDKVDFNEESKAAWFPSS